MLQLEIFSSPKHILLEPVPKAPPGLPEIPESIPMHILLEPEVIVPPAKCPKPTLDIPPTTFANASYPQAVFLPPVVTSVKALRPTATH